MKNSHVDLTSLQISYMVDSLLISSMLSQMNSFIPQMNSLFVVLNTCWIMFSKTLQIQHNIKTTKHNHWITCCHSILLVITNSLNTLSIHQIISEITSCNEFIKMTAYLNLDPSILLNWMRHIDQKTMCCLITKSKTNLYTSSMTSLTTLHSLNMKTHCFHVPHAE